MKEIAVALKFKETFYKNPDGTLVFHAIPQVGGDAPAVDFSDVHREHPSSWPADSVTAALRSEKAQLSALEEHKRQVIGSDKKPAR